MTAEIPSGPHRHVVMTAGHCTDAVVLRHLLRRPCRYLGVMGSTAKVTELRRSLREAEFSETEITRLHGPIGLPIQSQMPEETAVSIAAGLIRTRRSADF